MKPRRTQFRQFRQPLDAVNRMGEGRKPLGAVNRMAGARWRPGLWLALPLALALPAWGETPLVFGQSAALTGPARALGLGMQHGIRAAFEEANAEGGVRGRPLRLLSLDDAYEPEQAVANTRRLIEEEGVFAIIGVVGTPTSKATEPIATAAGVPYIAPFTGARFLREPERESVVNLRASYDQEAEEMIERLTRDLGVERVGLLYQDDSFGLAVRSGVRRALEDRGLELVAEGSYPRNTTTIKMALIDIQMKAPQAVILAGTYEPVATFIKWSRRIAFDPVFIATSFVGSLPLANELSAAGQGVFVTQVVPFPQDSAQPVVAAYQRALETHAPESAPGFISLEGYLAGRLAVATLRRVEGALTSARFLEATRSAGAFDIDGVSLRYGSGDNQGSDRVYLTVIDAEGKYQPVSKLSAP